MRQIARYASTTNTKMKSFVEMDVYSTSLSVSIAAVQVQPIRYGAQLVTNPTASALLQQLLEC